MRSFLLKAAGFFAIQAAFAIPLGLRMARQPAWDTYLAASVRKHDRLDRLPSPRLVFVGGSGTAFGIDSPRLEEALGLPVVNMGLYLPLGVDFMLSEVENELRRGDIVVVSPEYGLLFHQASPDALRQLVTANPRALRWLTPAQARLYVDQIHKPLGASARQVLSELVAGPEPAHGKQASFYSLGSFNEQGDFVAHHAMSPRTVDAATFGLGPTDDRVFRINLDRLNRFHRTCTSKGVAAFYSAPAAMREAVEAQRAPFDAVNRALESDLRLPRLHDPEETLFPAALFFDSKDHLTLEGKRRRTEILVRALSARLRR